MSTPHEVTTYSSCVLHPTPRSTSRAAIKIRSAVQVEQFILRAKTRVAEEAMFEVVALKRTQAELEGRYPDCAESLALIANVTVMSIAHGVARFCNELDEP